MLYYYRTDASERVDIDKISASKECDSCHCCYLVDKGYNFPPHVCN